MLHRIAHHVFDKLSYTVTVEVISRILRSSNSSTFVYLNVFKCIKNVRIRV